MNSPAQQTAGTQPSDTAVGGLIDDAWITTSIQAKYFADNAVKARRIDVDTQNGVVTVRGTVANDNERAQALLLAWTTQGVERVQEALIVDPWLAPTSGSGATAGAVPPTAALEDAALEDRVRSRLQADPQAQGGSIAVTAKDGVLLFDGSVPTAAVKQRALSLARETEGVVQVVDRLRVGRTR